MNTIKTLTAVVLLLANLVASAGVKVDHLLLAHWSLLHASVAPLSFSSKTLLTKVASHLSLSLSRVVNSVEATSPGIRSTTYARLERTKRRERICTDLVIPPFTFRHATTSRLFVTIASTATTNSGRTGSHIITLTRDGSFVIPLAGSQTEGAARVLLDATVYRRTDAFWMRWYTTVPSGCNHTLRSMVSCRWRDFVWRKITSSLYPVHLSRLS